MDVEGIPFIQRLVPRGSYLEREIIERKTNIANGSVSETLPIWHEIHPDPEPVDVPSSSQNSDPAHTAGASADPPSSQNSYGSPQSSAPSSPVMRMVSCPRLCDVGGVGVLFS